MKHSTFYLSGAIFVGLTALNRPPAIAQTPVLVPNVQAPKNTDNGGLHWNVLRIRNLKPSFLAWLIDPMHTAEPAELKISRANFEAMRVPESLAPDMAQWKARGNTPFDAAGQYRLPAGVMAIVPVDVQNALMVYATSAGLNALQEDLKTLDKPIKQLEVIATMVQVNFADMEALTSGAAKDERGAIAKNQYLMRGDYQIGLQKLIDDKKAVVKSAPRVTALNNLTALIGMTTGSPVEIGLRALPRDADQKKPDFQPAFSTRDSGVFYLNRGIQFSATPRIHTDGTITVLVAPEATLGLTRGSDNPTHESLKLPDLEGLQETIYVKDGETVALRGLTTRFFDYQPLETATATPTSEVVVLVTTRIIRRFGSQENIAGKQLASTQRPALLIGNTEPKLFPIPVSVQGTK